MAPTLVTTAYGRPAAAALHAQIVAAKRDEPLAPVTVVVPTNSVGVATRRLLASGELGPVTSRGRGLVGVTFLTVFRLAELLAAPVLAAAGRRPVSTPVVAAAVRRALADAPGVFAPVTAHPATEEALVAAHRELADLDEVALDTLARQSPRARDVVRIHRAVTQRLAPSWYAESDLMDAAVELVTNRDVRTDDLGALVCYLPQRLGAPAARLVRALTDVVPCVVVLGVTGDAAADAAVIASAGRLGCKVEDDEVLLPVPAATAVVTTSDPDDEVRLVVRALVDAMRSGIPLERMAVVYAGEEPYARLLHEHLTLAGIAHNGASVRALDDTALGRALLRMLSLPDEGFRRDDVFALLASAPVLDGTGRLAPAAAWERISRKAGVVAGLDEWRNRLDQHLADLGEEAARDYQRRQTKQLRAFIDALAADLDPASVPAGWSAKCAWAHGLIRRWIGSDRRRESWPPFEYEAARRVERALDRLSGLDTVEQAPTLRVFRRTLELELGAARDRIGRLGEGVLVGPVGQALGADLERLYVCGLADGVFPAPARDDPLLNDGERIALDGELRLRAERAADDHRALLAALASTAGDRVLFFPRGDLRRTTEHVASRYLLDTVERLEGVREFDGSEPWCTSVASFVDGLSRTPFPATRHEFDVQALLAGAPLAAAALGRGAAMIAARRSSEFTRFDGNLVHLAPRLAALAPTAANVVVSATRLQAWAKCPHAYFMQYLLHVEAVERPEEVVQLSPLDRGAIVHEVLDRFVAEGGTVADRARLHAIADEACARVEAHGLAGRRLLWDRDQQTIHAHLDAWLDADTENREALGLRTVTTEHRFGPLEVVLTDGRTIRFRGAIDRVDRAQDGHLLVFDYKTSSTSSYRGLSATNPVLAGTQLQLPLYARAARDLVGEVQTPAEAAYWFVGRGDDAWIGYLVDDEVDHAFLTAVGTIADGMEQGCFPAIPEDPKPWVTCPYCDPDGLGTSDRRREWERKSESPEVEVWWALQTEAAEELA